MHSSSEEEDDSSEYSDDDEDLSIEMVEYDLMGGQAEQSGSGESEPEGQEEESHPGSEDAVDSHGKRNAEDMDQE